MPRITCPSCGASAVATRTESYKMNIRYGEDFLPCQEIKERLAAGEESIPQGDCITFTQAILDAINSGSL